MWWLKITLIWNEKVYATRDNNKYIFEMMGKMHCPKHKKCKEFKNPKLLYICVNINSLYSNKCEYEDEKIFKEEELIEMLKKPWFN